MKNIERLPDHMKKEYGTLRNFKRVKRIEFNKLIKEIDQVRGGCAFFPQEAYLNFDRGASLIDKALKDLIIWWKNA